MLDVKENKLGILYGLTDFIKPLGQWGSSLEGLHTLDPPLSHPSTSWLVYAIVTAQLNLNSSWE